MRRCGERERAEGEDSLSASQLRPQLAPQEALDLGGTFRAVPVEARGPDLCVPH